ncbi:MAG: glucose 1-dehydrogenase [Pseudomonadota bacterium]
MLLSKRVAMVTGGGAGIGRAIAERLATEGAQVVIVDLKDTAGRETVAAVEALGGEAVYRSANISQRLDVHNLMAAAEDAFGHLDILVNNAGVVDTADFLDLEEAEFDRVMATNLKGAFLLSQAVARRLVQQSDKDDGAHPVGAIVNVSSVSAHYGAPDHVAYAASKGGLTQLTKSMALALAPHGIRVNAVAPGSIEGDVLGALLDSDEKRRDAAQARTPLGRFGVPAEIAAVVAWLASEQASYLTGTTIWADGGRMALNTVMPDKPDDE